MASLLKHIVVGQVWMELEKSSNIFQKLIFFLLQLDSFTVDSDPL